jgi:hypothetical protein
MPLLQTENALAIAMWDLLWRGLRGLRSRLAEGSRKKLNRMSEWNLDYLNQMREEQHLPYEYETGGATSLKARSPR